MFTRTYLGRCLLWRAPTARDHHRFPCEDAGGPAASPLRQQPQPIDPAALTLPASGRFAGGTLAALLADTGTLDFVALHDGAVACRWTAPGHDAAAVNRNGSVTASVGWALVGQASAAGRLAGADAVLGAVLPDLKDAGVAQLSFTQLMRMASGIRYTEGTLPWRDESRVHHGNRLRRAALRVRIADRIDRFFHHNDWHPLLIALALEQAADRRVSELLAQDLWGPLGAGTATISTDRRGDAGLAHLDSGFNSTAEGLARFGQMLLQGGRAGEHQLLPADWVARLAHLPDAFQSTAHFAYYRKRPWGRALGSGRYAYKDFWWHYRPRPGVHDWFAMDALGAHLYVSRDTRCVLVRHSQRFPAGMWWPPLLRAAAERLAGG